jgi:hypothetical protein
MQRKCFGGIGLDPNCADVRKQFEVKIM